MFLAKARKKIFTAAGSAALGIALSFSAISMPMASAAGWGDILGIGIGVAQVAQQREQVRNYLNQLNSTPEGQAYWLQSFQEQTGINDNAELNRRFDAIMVNLTNAVAEVDPSVHNLPYQYFINQQTSINAACGMGHVMMVNSGTFEHIVSDDEIAAIVGHELGHGQKNHVVNGIASSMDKTLLAQVAVAATGGTALGSLIGNFALNHSVVHATKSHEWEADGLAFEYMTHTNYNPGACAAVMQKFMELMGDGKQDFGEMLLNPSDHPNTEARRDKYVKQLYEYSGKHVTAKDGTVIVNGKKFVTPAPAGGMSAMERSYFVLGNLASAYKHGHSTADAHVENGTVMLGPQAILTPAEGDESTEILAERLNNIKDGKDKGKKNEE